MDEDRISAWLVATWEILIAASCVKVVLMCCNVRLRKSHVINSVRGRPVAAQVVYVSISSPTMVPHACSFAKGLASSLVANSVSR